MDIALILQYIIVGVIVYSGLFVGKILSLISPEEVRPGKKYLILLQKVVFLALLLTFAFMINVFMVKVVVIFVLGYFLFIMKRNTLYKGNNYYLIYTAIAIFLGFTNWSNIIYPAFLAFILGIPTMILNNGKKMNVYVKLLIIFFLFYIISFMSYNNNFLL